MKKVIFMMALALGLMSFTSDKPINEDNENIEIELSELTSELTNVYNCTFTYTLNYTNTSTGQSYSETYTRTTFANSRSDCENQARATASMHARVAEFSMNNQ